jgi:hypothetical protein
MIILISLLAANGRKISFKTHLKLINENKGLLYHVPMGKSRSSARFYPALNP